MKQNRAGKCFSKKEMEERKRKDSARGQVTDITSAQKATEQYDQLHPYMEVAQSRIRTF